MASVIKWRIAVICTLFAVLNWKTVMASQEIMSKLTAGFSKSLNQCKAELTVGDHIMQEFVNFWREEYQLVNRDMGCMLVCMAAKVDLISEDLNSMHHENAYEFAKKHGADDALAKQLVTIIKDCDEANKDEADPCVHVLEVAKCFRTKIHELKWAPNVEIILEEVMTAV